MQIQWMDLLFFFYNGREMRVEQMEREIWLEGRRKEIMDRVKL